MINILLVLNIIVVILLIGIILLQKSQGGVLGIGGAGSKNGVLTTKSAGDLITKTTYVLGTLFFIICITLAFLVARQNNSQKSFIETMMEKNTPKQVKTSTINKIPEDKVNEELKKESIKQEQKTKKKPTAPTL